MRYIIRNLIKENDGATMVEYGTLVAFLSVILLVALTAMGADFKAAFNYLNTTFSSLI